MCLGRIVELSSNHLLYSRPLHPYTEALMSAAPTPNPMHNQEEILLEGDVPSPINTPSGCSFHPRCRYHQKICIQETPSMEEIETNHWVACHFPIQKVHSFRNKSL